MFTAITIVACLAMALAVAIAHHLGKQRNAARLQAAYVKDYTPLA